jgi:ribosomal protein S18 acetylase RimI-like enzyme
MILKTQLLEQDWVKLVDMYDETNMFLGLGRQRDLEKIRRAYEKSHKYVVAWQNDRIIGAARMISDGECYGWIHDVAVLEESRRQGVGQAIMEKLQEGNEHLLMGLTSSFMAVDFYSDLGFKKHKTAMAKYPGPSDYLYYD